MQTLCRFYVKRPWGKEYPFVSADSSYMRQFDQTQLASIRDTLQRWGEPFVGMCTIDDRQATIQFLTAKGLLFDILELRAH